MANKNNKNRGTGFAAPMLGKEYPKGSTIKQNKDGTVTVIPPKDNKKKK